MRRRIETGGNSRFSQDRFQKESGGSLSLGAGDEDRKKIFVGTAENIEEVPHPFHVPNRKVSRGGAGCRLGGESLEIYKGIQVCERLREVHKLKDDPYRL